jgi:hypothetical protein
VTDLLGTEPPCHLLNLTDQWLLCKRFTGSGYVYHSQMGLLLPVLSHCSYGYLAARESAKKIVQCYKLCSEQLSSQVCGDTTAFATTGRRLLGQTCAMQSVQGTQLLH